MAAISSLDQLRVTYTPSHGVTDANGVIRIALSTTLAGAKDVFMELGATNDLLHPAPVFVPGLHQTQLTR